MADNEIYTVKAMRDYVRNALEEWLKGYTDPLADGKQRRIEITGIDDDWIYVRVQRMGTFGGYERNEKRYKIAIEVVEVTDGR